MSESILSKTDKPVNLLSPEDIAAIHKSAKEGHSWHVFQSYKKQAEPIKALEVEIAALKAAQP